MNSRLPPMRGGERLIGPERPVRKGFRNLLKEREKQ